MNVRGACFYPVMRQQLQIFFVVAALGEAFFAGFRPEVMGGCGAVVGLVIGWDVSQLYQCALQPQTDCEQRLGLGNSAPYMPFGYPQLE